MTDHACRMQEDAEEDWRDGMFEDDCYIRAPGHRDPEEMIEAAEGLFDYRRNPHSERDVRHVWMYRLLYAPTDGTPYETEYRPAPPAVLPELQEGFPFTSLQTCNF